MEHSDEILDAPQVEHQELNYAGFWIRFVAYLFDGVLLFIVSYGVGLVLGQDSLATNIVDLIIGIAYFSVMESSDAQATLGKMAVGIKVGDANGEQISFANALGRYFGKMLSALILLMGFIMVAWDEKCQGLHDKLAGTYVFYPR